MRILFAIDRYRPSRGGAERYLHDLGKALHAKGHHVVVACLEDEEDGFSERIRIAVPRHPRLARELALARAPGRLRRQGYADRTVAFRHVLEADRYQPHEGLFRDSLRGAIRPGSPHIVSQGLRFTRKLLSPKNLLFLWIDRMLLARNPDLSVAALSRMTAQSIRDRWKGDPARITVIHNGVDRSRFHPGLRERYQRDCRARWRVPEGRRIILFAGHNFRLKGLREAFEGLARHIRNGGDSMLVVAGKGRTAPYLALAGRLGILNRLYFEGDSEYMERLYGGADVLLHPTFYDPCSLVVLEALGAGVPVITTRFNGASELMENRDAGRVLTDPRDTHAVAHALDEVLAPEAHPDFQRSAAALGEENDFSLHVEAMERWILSG